LLARTETVIRQSAPRADLLREVVHRLAAAIREITPPEMVTRVMLPMLSGLDEETRTRAVGYFFTMS
jgi:hypothetical protein